MLKRKGAVVGLRYLYLFARPRLVRMGAARDLIVSFFSIEPEYEFVHESVTITVYVLLSESDVDLDSFPSRAR